MTDHPNRPPGLPERIRHFIGGEEADSLSGRTFDVLDPVSNRAYATAAAVQAADIARAAAAARHAFTAGPWPRMRTRERARVLNRIADAVEAEEHRVAELETFDTGLPITQARGQARRAAENFRFFADLIAVHAGKLEARARAGRRMPGGAQAGRVHPPVGEHVAAHRRRGRPARRGV